MMNPLSSETFSFENGFFTATHSGECIDFSFTNFLLGGQPKAVWEYLGNTITANMSGGDLPDMFSVTPAYGWQVMTENFLVVAEWLSATITVCPMLMG